MCNIYVWRYDMATNLAINDSLLEKALELGGFRSKKDTVNAALEEFIKRRKAEDIISIFGKIEYENDYDYKKLRNR
jgi:Arc/MetJ family transcription regulator